MIDFLQPYRIFLSVFRFHDLSDSVAQYLSGERPLPSGNAVRSAHRT